MTLFINGRFATQPLSGVQRYAGEILRALDALAGAGHGPDAVLLSPPGAPAARLSSIAQRWIGSQRGHRWEQWEFANAAQGGVALSLAMSGPLRHPRQLVVIHDAAVHRCPEHFSWRYAAAHRWLERVLARRAHIATVSEFSRRELAAVLGIAERDIVVAPNGADHVRGSPDRTIISRLGLDGWPFFLTLGNQAPNKNLAVIGRALARIDDPAVRLVVVGEQRASVFGRGSDLRSDPRIILAGRLTDREVLALLGDARALVFPSRYEGFGLPPLEAMAAGCPVLASDCAAVLEVCGGAAEHFGVDDVGALARLMVRALGDGAWRAARRSAGSARAGLYRWADSAAVLAAACMELDTTMAAAA